MSVFRGRVIAVGLLIGLLGCGDEAKVVAPPPDPPRAAAISISPESVELDFIGATATFTASVTDQYGAAYPGTIAWTGDSPSVFSVNGEGLATAISNGMGEVVASIEEVADTASLSVGQVPAMVQLARGGDQEGLPGAPLRDPVVVRVLDQGGASVAGAIVRFDPSAGHGSADPDSVATDANGDAATVWTLGLEAEPQLLTATATNGLKVRVTATATRGHGIEVIAGSRQRALPSSQLPEVLVVRVLDSKGGPFPGTTVVFEPEEGHGSASPDSAATDADGEAATIWTIGDQPGDQTLTVRVPGGPSTEVRAQGLTGLGVCDRTPQLRDVITQQVGVRDCADVTPQHLVSIRSMEFWGDPMTALYHDDFAGLSNLDSLDLSQHRLTALPLGLFSPLKSLRTLHIRGVWRGCWDRGGEATNQITDLPPGLFDSLISLTDLSLCGNRLTRLEPRAFAGLSELRRLSLSNNHLTDLAPGAFGGLTSLVKLDLGANAIADLSPGVFGEGLQDLRELNLGGNYLADLPAGVFEDLASLRELAMRGNRISDLPIGVFRGLTSLASLSLADNNVEVLQIGRFAGLINLEVLNLEANQMRTVMPGAFAELSSLQWLILRRNRLVALPPGAWTGLVQLKTLELWGNRLRRVDADMLVGLHGLTSLSIGDDIAAISGDAFAALPKLQGLYLRTVDFQPLSSITAAWGGISGLGVYVMSADGLRAGVFSPMSNLRWLSLGVRNPSDGVAPQVLLPSEHVTGTPPPAHPMLTDLTTSGSWRSSVVSGIGRRDNGRPLILPADMLAGVGHLNRLTIWTQDGSEVQPDANAFRGVGGLDTLTILGNVKSLPEKVFSGLTGLDYLGMMDTAGPGTLGLTELPEAVFADLRSLSRLYIMSHDLVRLEPGIFADLANVENLALLDNNLTSLPDGIFRGLHSLGSLDLRSNPGTPFPIGLTVARADTTDLAAPGPARVVVSVAKGAPHDITVKVHAPGASLSSGTATIWTGHIHSDTITVSRSTGYDGTVSVRVMDPSTFPDAYHCVGKPAPCYTGIRILIGDPITLFR